jgi:hypothetical protein
MEWFRGDGAVKEKKRMSWSRRTRQAPAGRVAGRLRLEARTKRAQWGQTRKTGAEARSWWVVTESGEVGEAGIGTFQRCLRSRVPVGRVRVPRCICNKPWHGELRCHFVSHQYWSNFFILIFLKNFFINRHLEFFYIWNRR